MKGILDRIRENATRSFEVRYTEDGGPEWSALVWARDGVAARQKVTRLRLDAGARLVVINSHREIRGGR